MTEAQEAMTRIVVRQARHRDGESVGRLLLGLPTESRHQRFLTPLRYLSPTQIQNMVTLTPHQLVLLAVDGDAVVGHLMASASGRIVDVALAVAEGYRHRGIGRRLISELATYLAPRGYSEICCHVVSQNHVVLSWLRRLLSDVRFEWSQETMAVQGRLTTGPECGS